MYLPRVVRDYPSAWRVILAFGLAPGAAALLMAVYTPAYEGLTSQAERIWRTAQIFGLVGAYPTAVLVGIPAYFVLRRHFAAKPLNCMLAGSAIAAFPWVVRSLVLPGADYASTNGRATVVNGRRTWFGWLEQVEFIIQIAAFGFIAGLIFWAVAAAGHRSRSLNENP